MRETGKGAGSITAKRQKYIETAYGLFSSKNIESVSLEEIARESGQSIATLYRYFTNKQTLVVETATWKWKQFGEDNQKRRPRANFEGMTAAEIFEFYLDSFLVLYRDHGDLLRFNQFFNVYIRAEKVDAGTLKPYQSMICRLKDRFHVIYDRAQEDHTLRTDEPEEELLFQKNMILRESVNSDI